MTSRAIDRTAMALPPEPPGDLSAEIVRLKLRVAQLEADNDRAPRPSGPLTLEEFLRPIRRAKEACDLHCPADNPESRTVKVVRPTGMTLPESSALRRDPPREPADRQPGYLDEFDSRTLFYDAFRFGNDVWLCGPPLNNLKSELEGANWRLDGINVSGSLQLGDWDRTQRSRIVGGHPGKHLSLDLADSRFDMVIAPDESDLFAGQRTIITKSKDNDLVWIKDFLHYYHVVHGVTGVVFYDNNSTQYSPEDVAEAISSVRGISTAVVVSWNYPWGPEGGPKKVWDSDYCQYGMLEHGHFRYLSKAAGVISADIDELVLTNDGRTVFDHAAESESGAVGYHGYWIAKATVEPMHAMRQRRFVDYRHRTGRRTTKKWTIIPGMQDWQTTQWRVHSVPGVNAEISEQIHHRHYEGVNNGWRYNRTEDVVTPGTHFYDVRMSRVLDMVFGS